MRERLIRLFRPGTVGCALSGTAFGALTVFLLNAYGVWTALPVFACLSACAFLLFAKDRRNSVRRLLSRLTGRAE